MPTAYECPSCHKNLTAPDHLLGQEVQCPACGATFLAGPSPGRPDGRPAVSPPPAVPRSPETASPGATRRPRERHYDEDEDDWERGPERRPARELAALPGQGRATAAVVILLLNLAVRLVSIFLDLYRYRLASRAARGAPLTRAEVDLFDTLSVVGGLALLAVNLATIIAVCMWIYRAYDNLAYLRAAGRQYSPGWAVGYFFIPILNLFRPCQVVQEIWRASDPAVPAEDRYAWQGRPGSVLVGFWWAFWLVTDIFGGIIFQLDRSPDPTPATVKIVTLLSAIDDAFAAPAALFLALVIYRIRVRQAEKHAHLRAARDRDEWDEGLEDDR
jgi:hypothetical protein